MYRRHLATEENRGTKFTLHRAVDRSYGKLPEKGNSMQNVKGMVVVAGKTYRIVRQGQGQYEVVRILDDLRVGSFRSSPRIEVTSASIEPARLLEIARVAIQGAKTSWIGRIDLP